MVPGYVATLLGRREPLRPLHSAVDRKQLDKLGAIENSVAPPAGLTPLWL